MSKSTYQYWFKGDNLINLYRIEATLISTSPLHIGTGETYLDEKAKNDLPEGQKIPEIAEIERDYRGLPHLPGSALRGVVRHYLLNIFRSFGNRIANDPDYDKETYFRDMKQKDQIAYMEKNASLLEQLFGTPFCETKIEFWDAALIKKSENIQFESKGWNPKKQSYVVRSVAIDPVTGAASPNKLYSFDVAATGLEYQVTIVGRNLSDEELGFLLFGLEGFKSSIYPLSIGAMSGRGFGRMNCTIKNIYKLIKKDIPDWLSLTNNSDKAGYELLTGLALPETEQQKLIKQFKTTFLSWLKENVQ